MALQERMVLHLAVKTVGGGIFGWHFKRPAREITIPDNVLQDTKGNTYLLPSVECVQVHGIQSRAGTRASRKEQRIDISDITARKYQQRPNQYGRDNVDV